MFLEFFMEVFFIRIKLHGYIENITKKTKEIIDAKAIKNKNIIKFTDGDVNYKIITNDNSIKLIRENQQFFHEFEFILNKETKSIYYIKELNNELEINVISTNILLDEKHIIIEYTINESSEKYKYYIEMSE